MRTTYTVFVHSNLNELLEHYLSPMDEIVAIDDLHLLLPKHHKPKRLRSLLRRNSLPLYRCRVDWADLEFEYVQLGTNLHVLDLWYRRDPGYQFHGRRPDVVLPEREEPYVPVPAGFMPEPSGNLDLEPVADEPWG